MEIVATANFLTNGQIQQPEESKKKRNVDIGNKRFTLTLVPPH